MTEERTKPGIATLIPRSLALAAPFAWAAVIFVLSHSPRGPDLPESIPHLDKLLHAGAYAILAGLTALALFRTTSWSLRRIAWTALILSSLYGVTDELHQAFIPGRTADPADWLADTLGAATILLVTRCRD